MPRLLDFKEFCKDLKEVSSLKIINKRKFHSEGLFSEQIFGPLRNYTCQCGNYYGPSMENSTCDDCGVDIVNSVERRKRFAKINLVIPVINPIFLELIFSICNKSVKNIINKLMKDEESILYKNGDDFLVTNDESLIPQYNKKWDKLEAIKVFVESIAKQNIDEGLKNWKIILKNIEQLIIENIIVLPPDLRPASKKINKNSQVVDQINRYYTQILTKNQTMLETMFDIKRDKKIFYQYYKQLQADVNELYEHIITRLSKKEGLIRGNILGKRIDFSGRAVIIPEPTIELDVCILPYTMFLELFKIKVSRKLIELGKFKLLNNAVDFVDKCIIFNKPSLFRICEELAKDELCLLNRQPTLHRLSMVGFKIKISLDYVIKIHPLVCSGFNADFDGDQMAVYIPISKKTKEEILNRMMVTENFTNPSNGSLATTPSQDIILGIYVLTNNLIPSLKEKSLYKGKKITKALIEINKCFPFDFELIEKISNGKELISILNKVNRTYKNNIVKNIIDNIKKLGFKYSTLFGSTMSLDSFFMKSTKEIRKNIYSAKTASEQLQNVLSNEVNLEMKKHFKYSYMIESGARGSWDQVRQMILTRGFVSNFEGQILKTPIKNSLVDGLNRQEFFNSTYGCRKGLLDVALNTGQSGYLSRKLIFTCVNLQISKTLDDCGTNDFLSVYVKNEKKAKMLIYKYYKNEDGNLELINKKNYKSFIKKTILIRSPIFCKSYKICKKCYGELYKIIDSRFAGIIAAQALGECNTQLTLRTFHTSGVASKREDSNSDMIQQDIIADLSSASKLLHQVKDKNFEELVSELYDIYNVSRTIFHVHFESVVTQLMWNGNMKWRLLEDRNINKINMYSVQSVPSYESWLLGLAFSNPSKHIIKGLLYSGQYTGIMDRMLLGEKI